MQKNSLNKRDLSPRKNLFPFPLVGFITIDVKAAQLIKWTAGSMMQQNPSVTMTFKMSQCRTQRQ